MEGLEISILKSTEFLKDNFDFRLDAEYFLKDNLNKLEILSKVGFEKVSTFGYVTDGIHTSIDYCEDSNVNLFSATTPRENYFDLTRQVFISKKAHELNPRTALKLNDIVISTVGTIGNCAVVNQSVLPANSDRHVGIIRLENDLFLPRYVSTFLLTKYGRFQTWRESTGNVQLNLFLYRIRTLKIAKLSLQFQKKVEELILLNDTKREKSKQAYAQAEQVLLFDVGLLGNPGSGFTEVNLGDWVSDDPVEQLLADQMPGVKEELELLEEEWDSIFAEQDRLKAIVDYQGQITHFQKNHQRLISIKDLILEKTVQLKFIHNNRNLLHLGYAERKKVNIKSFKESFGATGRLDAEYYQKKYDYFEDLITSQKFSTLKELRVENYRGLQPIYFEDGDLDVINSKHILETCLDYDNFEKTKMEYWNHQEKARVFKGDILTYTTGANIGRTQVYLKDKKALASNHVNIIRLKNGNPVYIAFVLNSKIGRLQTEKRSAGSAQAELYPKDLDEFLIPIIDFKRQEQIAELVEESFKLKAESERLLEVAKKAVEMAIETDEETAMQFIAAHGVSSKN